MGNQRIHRGIDLRKSDNASLVAPGVSLLGCDLRGVALVGDLSNVALYGCRLDGTSFAKTSGARAWILDCVVTDGPRPVFEGADIGELIIDGGNIRDDRWSTEMVNAIANALAGDSSIAHAGLEQLATSRDASVASCLIGALPDVDDAVRWHVLKVLVGIRGNGVPHGEKLILETIALLLSDESSLITRDVVSLVQAGWLSTLYVRLVLDRVTWPAVTERRLALRAANTLVRTDASQRTLVPLGAMLLATQDVDAEVRRLAIQLFAWVKSEATETVVLGGLRDTDPSVRVVALRAFPIPSTRSPRALIVPLQSDGNATVRAFALVALAACDVLENEDLTAASMDPSDEVRAMAALVAQSSSRDPDRI